MFWSDIIQWNPGSGTGLEPLLLLLFAMLIEAYVGEAKFIFRFVPHPVVLIGRLVGVLDRKLNREKRSGMDRAVRGFITVLVVCGVVGTVGAGIDWVSKNHPFGWIIELVLIISLIAQRGLFDAVRRVGVALRDASLEDARGEVSHVVGRDPAQLDDHGVARAAIESLAENFSDGVVAPVFWYVLFGFPGLVVYKAINTLDSMIGYRNDRYRAFGFSAARIDDIVNYVPARLAGLLLALAAMFTPQARPGLALKTMLRDASKHRSVNAGWPEGAVAGALDLALAGPRRYPDRVVRDPWIGAGTAKATHADIRRALFLYAVAGLLLAAAVGGLAVFNMMYLH